MLSVSMNELETFLLLIFDDEKESVAENSHQLKFPVFSSSVWCFWMRVNSKAIEFNKGCLTEWRG